MTRTSLSDRPVLLLGGGSHGRVILACLVAMGRVVVGILDDNAHRLGGSIDGCAVLGDESVLQQYDRDAVDLAIGLGLLPVRQQVYERFSQAGYRFAQTIHPSVVINGRSEFRSGCQLMPGVVIQPGVVVADNVLVNTRASVDHECCLERHAVISPGAVLCGNVVVEESVVIGPGATITRGVRLGRGSVIAAGAVVVRDVPPQTTVYGIPARARLP